MHLNVFFCVPCSCSIHPTIKKSQPVFLSIHRFLVATILEPTYARKVFPCFDEPDLKAVFHVTIVHRKLTQALGNAEVKGSNPHTLLWHNVSHQCPLSHGDGNRQIKDVLPHTGPPCLPLSQYPTASTTTGRWPTFIRRPRCQRTCSPSWCQSSRLPSPQHPATTWESKYVWNKCKTETCRRGSLRLTFWFGPHRRMHVPTPPEQVTLSMPPTSPRRSSSSTRPTLKLITNRKSWVSLCLDLIWMDVW